MIDPKVGVSGREPQSEQEDQDKKLDFQLEITKEAKKFLIDIQSLVVVNQQDLKNLDEMLEIQNKQIEKLGKFKDECSAPFLAVVTQVRRKMTDLEN